MANESPQPPPASTGGTGGASAAPAHTQNTTQSTIANTQDKHRHQQHRFSITEFVQAPQHAEGRESNDDDDELDLQPNLADYDNLDAEALREKVEQGPNMFHSVLCQMMDNFRQTIIELDTEKAQVEHLVSKHNKLESKYIKMKQEHGDLKKKYHAAEDSLKDNDAALSLTVSQKQVQKYKDAAYKFKQMLETTEADCKSKQLDIEQLRTEALMAEADRDETQELREQLADAKRRLEETRGRRTQRDEHSSSLTRDLSRRRRGGRDQSQSQSASRSVSRVPHQRATSRERMPPPNLPPQSRATQDRGPRMC